MVRVTLLPRDREGNERLWVSNTAEKIDGDAPKEPHTALSMLCVALENTWYVNRRGGDDLDGTLLFMMDCVYRGYIHPDMGADGRSTATILSVQRIELYRGETPYDATVSMERVGDVVSVLIRYYGTPNDGITPTLLEELVSEYNRSYAIKVSTQTEGSLL